MSHLTPITMWAHAEWVHPQTHWLLWIQNWGCTVCRASGWQTLPSCRRSHLGTRLHPLWWLERRWPTWSNGRTGWQNTGVMDDEGIQVIKQCWRDIWWLGCCCEMHYFRVPVFYSLYWAQWFFQLSILLRLIYSCPCEQGETDLTNYLIHRVIHADILIKVISIYTIFITLINCSCWSCCVLSCKTLRFCRSDLGALRVGGRGSVFGAIRRQLGLWPPQWWCCYLHFISRITKKILRYCRSMWKCEVEYR